MIDAIVATRMERSPSVQGDKASDACGAASILRALCPTPGSSTSRQLKRQPRSCAKLFAALYTFTPRITRRSLGQRLGIIVSLVVAGIALAEIDRQRLLQISP
jgi:hypothetical protein